VVASEEWGTVTGEGEENLVEHDGLGLKAINNEIMRAWWGIRSRILLALSGLVDDALSKQHDGAKQFESAHLFTT